MRQNIKRDWQKYIPEILEAAKVSESINQMARILDVPNTSLKDALWRLEIRHDVEKLLSGGRPVLRMPNAPLPKEEEEEEEESSPAEDVYNLLRKRSKKNGMTVEELADELDVPPKRVREATKELARTGRFVHWDGDVLRAEVPLGEPSSSEPAVALDIKGATHFYVGVASDTHFGSKVQQPTALRNFMEQAEEKYDPVCWLHPGDIEDGFRVYPGHIPEIWLTGVDEQTEYAATAYPKTGKKTYIIGGNHDASHITNAGADPLERLHSLRPDIEPIGWRGAYVDVGGVSYYLWHGKGGLQYAKSYKLQKRVEGFGAHDAPQILLAGHWHTFCWVNHRDVHAFLVSGWQGQTSYITSLGYTALIGGMILECVLDDEGKLTELTPHMSTLSKPVEKDYPSWS